MSRKLLGDDPSKPLTEIQKKRRERICHRLLDEEYPKARYDWYRDKKAIQLAQDFRRNPTEAEIWFKKEWDRSGLYLCKKHHGKRNLDLFNYPVGPYVPYVINFVCKYVIEIDEPSTNPIQNRDKQDRFFSERGMSVFRIPPHDMKALEKCMVEVVRLRAAHKIPIGKPHRLPWNKRQRAAEKMASAPGNGHNSP